MLQGGLYSNQITEIIGLAGSGKTEFCVNVSLTSLITTIDHIVYIHSLGQNGLNRLKAKAESMNLSENEINELLKRFFHIAVGNSKELILLLASLIS